MLCEQPSYRTILPAQAKSTFSFLGSLSLLCAFKQEKKEYQGPIMADTVITIANNSSHEAVASSPIGGK